ncbi:MAG: hypothetical protein ABSH35_05180 [Isosphaeraceae bacterium]|jgi:hypothetical protein
MAGKRTFLEWLTSLLRGQGAAVRDSNEGTGASSSAETPLGLEWATYQASKRELLRYEGQWVVIHGEQILGIRPSYEEALRLGYERAGYVDFLARQILASEPVHLLPPQPI